MKICVEDPNIILIYFIAKFQQVIKGVKMNNLSIYIVI